IAGAKVAAQSDLIEDSNWKLVMENNRECYHCEAGHPEMTCTFFPTYGYAPEEIPKRLQPAYQRFLAAEEQLHANCERNGLPYALVEELSGRPTGFRIERAALDGKGESYTMDGSAASAKLLGDLDTFVLGRASLHVQPNTWFHAMGDHVVTFSLLPLAADKTLVRTTWLVAPDAEEGVDYDLENLTTVWIKTNEQDAHFCELAQSGVSSPAYEPGPYAPTESQVDDFVTWYIERLKAHRDATDSRGERNSDEVPSLESAVGRRIVGRRSTAGGEGDIPRARARHSPEVGGTADSVGRAAWRADCCRADPTRGTVGRADGCCTCRSCRTCRSRRPRTAHGPRRCRGHHRGDPRREDLRAAGGLDDLRRLRTRPIRDHARARARPRAVLFDLLGAVRDEYVHHHGQARGR